MERYIKHLLSPEERPEALYEYFVSGRGVFPFDMVRYDSCWPATSEDARKMDWGHMGGHIQRSVKMRSYQEPTIDRWLSFLWSVGKNKMHS
jgi:hypothetical protein